MYGRIHVYMEPVYMYFLITRQKSTKTSADERRKNEGNVEGRGGERNEKGEMRRVLDRMDVISKMMTSPGSLQAW